MSDLNWFWFIIPCIWGLAAPRGGFVLLGFYFAINGAAAVGWLA